MDAKHPTELGVFAARHRGLFRNRLETYHGKGLFLWLRLVHSVFDLFTSIRRADCGNGCEVCR